MLTGKITKVQYKITKVQYSTDGAAASELLQPRPRRLLLAALRARLPRLP